MSGICALAGWDGRPLDPGAIDRMIAVLRPSGEGRDGIWVHPAECAGFGSRIRRVTAEDEFEQQPLRSADGQQVVVADARLDNRPELARKLGIPTQEAARLPDSAFLLAAYRAWGGDCARQLVGDFAFVVWDERHRSLYCARDPSGQRALFYHDLDGRLAVASSAPAVLAGKCLRAVLDQKKVAELLVLLEDQESTCFAGVKRLPGGHSLTATSAGVRVTSFWNPDLATSLAFRSEAEGLEAFGAVFDRAVRDRVRSAKPVAALISGGLDSTSVAAVAARALRDEGRRLLCYHSAPPVDLRGSTRAGWVFDESDAVAELASWHDNIDLTVVRHTAKTPLDDTDRWFEAVNAPLRNSLNIAWYGQLYQLAADHGAGVMLNGGGGNLTVSYTGLRSIPDRARRGHLWSAAREAFLLARVRGQRPAAVLGDQVVRPLLDPATRLLRRRRRSAPPIWESRLSAIRPEFARAMGVEATMAARREDDLTAGRMPSAAYRLHVLRSLGDGQDVYPGMRNWFPIETRSPTTDVRVIEFCLAAPANLFLKDGHDRLLIRRGMRGLVPDSVLSRQTRGTQAADWTLWFPGMRASLAAELTELDRHPTARECLDLPRLNALMNRWPGHFDQTHFDEYALRLLRGVLMGRFIRWFEAR